ncbi:Telomere length regulator protein rif1 [Tolypocladium ophioglossoides CBS 100239]|uniref:Telomere length regulator protein rif1 n=1 Tax=Tolypocladium ophioglossoides (strain CBS 100239) TaxID=1163406 RepID=A0A0L0NAZ3_TOLOC|nr:Telomere length regulator protein rif1 [Tolypocladium ophioglossoides CBS 100239]
MASSAASASSTNILTSLPARPPTPPREASHDVDVSLRSVVLGRSQAFDPRRSLQTPPNAHSPASSAVTGSNPSSTRMRKKVEWSNHTEYKDPPEYRDGGRLNKSSPLSAATPVSLKPIKGILKPSSPDPLSSSLGVELDGKSIQPNIIEMLDSTIKQLAGSDRDSKLDAYMMLARALKTSDNLPDRVALQDKMSLFMQFIQRDITSKNETGTLDTSLVNHALTLLATFLHFPAIASTLNSDFGVFIIDHSIRSFEDATMPKDVVRHLMQVVAFQSFSAKVMTPDRVGRLLAALHKIEDHLKGKSIVMSRLHIYKRLVKQSRTCMATHSDWLKDMFTDMLSTIRDIRSQAISLGTEAGFALRSDKLLFRKSAEIFKATNDDETYIDFYIKRLQGMFKEKQTSSAVPQIWSVVILFLRCPLDRWQYYSPWLILVQSAFNMTDGVTKQEANNAWNRYVYLSLLDSKMSSKAIGTLCQPLLSQLRRKTSNKQQDEAMKLRRVVIGGVCSLYYFAFAQGADKYPNEAIWDAAVQPIMTQLISLDGKPDVPGDCMMQAARMLVGLLDVSTPRPSRSMDRILDTTPLGPEELLPIDSKWVRRNCDRVLQAVGPILEKKFADLANPESLVFRLWQALVSSVGAASVKDIKVSDDTAKFFACSFGLLFKVWSKGLSCDDGLANAKLLPSVKHFVQLIVDKIGLLPFTEKKRSMGADNTFEPVATPSQRLDKNEKTHGTVRIPLHHLFSMLCPTPPGCADDEQLANLFQSVFDPFFKARNNDKSRVDFARELIQLLPRNSPTPFGPWLLVAEHMKLSLDIRPAGSASTASGTEKLLGPICRELVSLLERGLTCHPNLPIAHWESLFDFVSANVLQEFGDSGRALVVIEPLAKVVLDNSSNSAAPSSMNIQAMTMLFDSAKLPRDRQALESARLRLWGAPPAVGKAGSSDPFDNLYRLFNHMMELFYDRYADIEAHAEVDAFVGAVEKFFDSCLSQAGIKTVSKMQPGLCSWVQDEKTQLRMSDKSSIFRTLRQLWDRVCIELTSHGRLEKKDFDQIEPLLTAAFKSKDPFILSRAADVWNAAIKDEEKVECSDSLLSIVSSLRSKVDLIVPGADPSSGGFGAQAPPFIGQLDDQSFVAISSASSRHDSNQAAAPAVPVSKRSATRKRRMELVPEVCEKPAKRKSAPRLRHDDSQMRFASIAPSSPQHDESQHLTDRQKEVRERQRENAALYPDIRPSSLAGSLEVVPKNNEGEETTKSERLARDTTPKDNTSFDELISSTPTPRRGQVLPMDDANDPPSSPPIPRPYPLLSQIQSRSRANSSLENWEFSSPTGSPVASHQHHTDAQDDEPASPVPTEEVVQPRTRRAATRQRRAAAKERATAKVIPSSITDDEQNGTDGQREGKTKNLPADLPATPPQRRLALPRQVQETPKSGEDEFVDARSNPEHSLSPHQPELSARDGHSRNDAKDTSFALSENEERSMMNLVVELESRRYELPITRGDSSPPKKSVPEDVEKSECIMVRGDSSSPPGPTTRRRSERPASLVTPSTPAEATDKEAEGRAKRKRKRGGQRHAEGRGKRRRSAEAEDAPQPEDQPKANLPAPTMDRGPRRDIRMETRRSSRKRKQQTAGAADLKAGELQTDKEAVSAKRIEGPDAEDTEEELMSQLETESLAASQQNHSHADEVPCQTTNEEPTKSTGSANATLARTAEAKPREDNADGEDETLPIMETLRSGLDQLRNAALPRDRVYEMETVLMDLKRELYEAERRGREAKESA